ncbi:MAG: hypothetical protein KDA84_02975, partial [Planctomycetaceae bacterium]|nr:hypothetical protein [Planctomycetaceae bacterium]
DDHKAHALKRWEIPPRFDARAVYRDVTSSEMSLKIREQLEQAMVYPDSASDCLQELVAYLGSLVKDADRPSTERAEANLGLLAVGPKFASDVNHLFHLAQTEPETTNQVLRLRSRLADPVIRAARIGVNALERVAPHFNDPDTPIDLMGAVLELAIRHGSPPLLTAQSDGPGRSGNDAKGYLLAEAWAYWMSGSAEDIRYNAAVVLDTIGKQLGVPELFVQVMSRLHLAKNLGWSQHLGWSFEKIAVVPLRELDRVLMALDCVAAMPKHLEFVKYWALTDVLFPLLQNKYPDLIPEWRVILISIPFKLSFDVVEKHWPDTGVALHDSVYGEIERIQDPLLKTRALARLALVSGKKRERLVAEAREVANRIPLWDMRTWLRLRPTAANALRRTMALETLLPLAGEQLPSLLQDTFKAVRWLDPDNKARALLRLARFAEGEQQGEIMKRVARAIPSISDENQRSKLFALLRPELELYPEWVPLFRQMLVGFRDLTSRSRAAGWLGPALSHLQPPAPFINPFDPQQVAVLELAGRLEDALGQLPGSSQQKLLWRCLGQGEEEALNELESQASLEEMTLNLPAALCLNRLMKNAEPSFLLRALRIVREPEPPTVPLVESWTREHNLSSRVKASVALLFAEAGHLRVDTVPHLVACLSDPEDRIRYRAHKVFYFKGNARHTRGMGKDVMEALAAQVLDHRVRNPPVSLTVVWMWENALFNNPDDFRDWIRQAKIETPEREKFLILIKSLTNVSPDVWRVGLEELPLAPPKVQSGLLRSFKNMLERLLPTIEQQLELQTVLLDLFPEAEEEVKIGILRNLGWTGANTVVHPLDSLASGAHLPEKIQAVAIGEAGRRWARHATGVLHPPVKDKNNPPEPVPLDKRLQLMRHLEGFAGRFEKLGQASSTELQMGYATAMAHLHLVCCEEELLPRSLFELPKTLDRLCTLAGGADRAFWGLLETDRSSTIWGKFAKLVIRQAAALVIQ